MKEDDPEFVIELRMLACEFDFSEYLSVKSIIFIKLLKRYYMKWQLTKLQSKINISMSKDDLQTCENKFKSL